MKNSKKMAVPIFDAQGAVFHCFKLTSAGKLGKRLPDVRVKDHGGRRQCFEYVNSPLESK